MKSLLKAVLPVGAQRGLQKGREHLLKASLEAAIAEQGLLELANELREILPDIRKQYSSFEVDTPFLETKLRGQHAFQLALAGPEIASRPKAVVVDIGDSSGMHTAALKALYPGERRWLSVNLDKEAVARVRARGFEALEARAEELGKHGIDADVFLSFETVEHLPDPINFLHALAAKTRCQRLVLTVPYVRQSRVGLHHLRANLKKPVTAETVHLFELSPADWKLVFRHAGWKLERERTYLQYPRHHPLAATRPIWRSWDFEGFYGAVLSRDDAWSSLYASW